jgi:hypothetical protein
MSKRIQRREKGLATSLGACRRKTPGEFMTASQKGTELILGYLWLASGLSSTYSRLLKSNWYSGCSKMSRCKAPEIPKSEAYMEVRRNDEE